MTNNASDNMRKPQLAVFISHPIQHFSPLFKALKELLDLHVFYYSDFGQKQHHIDPGFGVPVKWDVPLLEGYKFSFLPSVPWQSQSYNGKVRLNFGLLKALRQKRWDGVLLFGYSSINNLLIWLLASLLRIPLLYMSDSELLHSRSWARLLTKELPLRLFFRRISAYLSIGDHNDAYAARYGVEKSRRYRAVYPVDVERFKQISKLPDLTSRLTLLRHQYNIPNKANVVLFCGKLIPRKRPLDLAKALHLIPPKPYPLIALFLGAGPLEGDIRRIGGNSVRITGFVNQSDIPLYYALSILLVHPAQEDAHPLVITEAASLGVPAIVSDHVGCVGPTDILRNGENGIVYPCGNIEKLAQAIDTLLEGKKLRYRMGMRGQELAETQCPIKAARHIRDALIQVVSNSSE